jgi:hypothetical protein
MADHPGGNCVMSSNKDRPKSLANSSRRIGQKMTDRTIADRFEAMADEWDRQAEEASDEDSLDAQMAVRTSSPDRGERAPE